MTLGVAAAANYPAPFVSGGVANAAIVYGTGAGVSSLDLVQAGNIQDSLGTFVRGGTVTVEGGESFTLEKTSNKFNLGDALNGAYSNLDDQQLESFLADGTYNDGDVDEDYTQEITLSNKALALFADNDYNDKEPTLGFRWTNGQNILSYNMSFDNVIPFADLTDTDFPILGKSYYVLSTTSTKIELLDSADKVVLQEGNSVTVGDKTVSIEFIDSTDVKFNVDGEITDKLGDHEYYELDDGSYIVANEVLYNEKESGISSVEFSIGQGKMILEDGEELDVNDEAVDGLVVGLYTNGTAGFLDTLGFTWNSDDETYLTSEQAITMPVFETVKLVFGGMNFPDNPETVSLENGETMTLSMGNYELPLFTFGATANTSTMGEEDYALVTSVMDVGNDTAGNVSANGYQLGSTNTTPLSGGLNLMEDNRFLVTSLDTDLGDTDTLYYEVTKIDWDGSDVVVELRDLIGDKDLTFDDTDDEETIGDVSLNITQVNDTNVYFYNLEKDFKVEDF